MKTTQFVLKHDWTVKPDIVPKKEINNLEMFYNCHLKHTIFNPQKFDEVAYKNIYWGSLDSLIGRALRPRLSGKPVSNVYSPDGHVGNAEAGLNIILYSDWL